MLDELAALVHPSLLDLSGEVFYSGRTSFVGPRDLYVLGLNPGGCPVKQVGETVGAHLERMASKPHDWSSYRDDGWLGRDAGVHGLQPNVLHLFARLGHAPHDVPSSNLIFVRTQSAAALGKETRSLMDLCWPFHAKAIEGLGARVVVCFGARCGDHVRERLGAREEVASYTEVQPIRRWTSRVHRAPDGKQVVTLSHPSRAHWRLPHSDPTGLVVDALTAATARA